jgi:uncharacterized membrane protein
VPGVDTPPAARRPGIFSGAVFRPKQAKWKDRVFVLLVGLFTLAALWIHTGFERPVGKDSAAVRARVVSVDNSSVRQYGFIREGAQLVRVRVLDGRYRGQEVDGSSTLLGKLELDKFFAPGDIALVVLDLDSRTGAIRYANLIDHYRLHVEILLFALFAAALVIIGGWTGAKALLSFVFSIVLVWKVLLPFFLRGIDPILVSLGVVTVLTAVVIFLVGGVGQKGVTAFLGVLFGISVTCVLAIVFGRAFRVNGAVRPFSETLLYTGFAHLDLTRLFFAGIFLASSGAVMDVSMDVAASMEEVRKASPAMPRRVLIASGFKVGRAVVGTMTTTLLLAYSGGYTALLMVFMAQGTPVINIMNITYVAAEILHTLVGSFGVVLVAPATAIVGGLVFTPRGEPARGPRAAGDRGAIKGI